MRFSLKDRTFEVNKTYLKLLIMWLFVLVSQARNGPVGITRERYPRTRQSERATNTSHKINMVY